LLLSTSEGGAHEEPPVEGISRRRIFSLSDLIFGLALSIGALTLIGQQPSTTEQFVYSLGQYGFSFVVLIGVWVMYSRITSVLPTESAVLVRLNVILLFVVSIEPYLFNELFAAKGGLLLSVSSAFGIDLAVMFFVLAFFNHTLASEQRQLVPTSSLAAHRRERNRNLLVAIVFSASVIPYFGQIIAVSFTSGGVTTDLSIRDVMWLVAMVITYSSRLLSSLTRTD